MDQNEMMNQLANNPQMLAQLIQMMQQNGMIPSNQPSQRQPMNWNVPTNPMAAVWWNNMINAINNMCNNSNQQNIQNNNQNQQTNIQTNQKLDDDITSPSIRVVHSPDDIKIGQIPINDKINLFIQDDASVIYGKRWTNNGAIENLRFVLDTEPEENGVKTSDNIVTGNQGFNVDELMVAVANTIDSKLEQFKKELAVNNYSQSKGRPKPTNNNNSENSNKKEEK